MREWFKRRQRKNLMEEISKLTGEIAAIEPWLDFRRIETVSSYYIDLHIEKSGKLHRLQYKLDYLDGKTR